jgi:hypothetical protein
MPSFAVYTSAKQDSLGPIRIMEDSPMAVHKDGVKSAWDDRRG